MAASDSEDDLFEEARQDLRSLAPGQKDLKMPESKELFDETETSNKLLAKGIKETVVAEGNDDAENNEEKLQKLLISQLRIMGQLENKNSGDSGGTVRVKVMNKSTVEDDKIDCLEDDDISKYIGDEEDDEKDKLFG